MTSYRRFVLAALAATCAGASASRASGVAEEGFVLRLQVPVLCNVSHRAIGAGVSQGDGAYSLGELDEYCNAPQGYRLTVDYTPGSLKGAVIMLGGDRVTLDGSGTATLYRANGPKIRENELAAIPGAGGFDTDRLNFAMQAV